MAANRIFTPYGVIPPSIEPRSSRCTEKHKNTCNIHVFAGFAQTIQITTINMESGAVQMILGVLPMTPDVIKSRPYAIGVLPATLGVFPCRSECSQWVVGNMGDGVGALGMDGWGGGVCGMSLKELPMTLGMNSSEHVRRNYKMIRIIWCHCCGLPSIWASMALIPTTHCAVQPMSRGVV
jgi:hypothetical protein